MADLGALAMLRDSIDKSITNWATTLRILQAAGAEWSLPATSYANSPFDFQRQIPRIQAWLDNARAARAALDPVAMQQSVDTAKNAWRPVASAMQSVGPTLQSVAPSVEPTAAGSRVPKRALHPRLQRAVGRHPEVPHPSGGPDRDVAGPADPPAQTDR
jgi:hypothetical protein